MNNRIRLELACAACIGLAAPSIGASELERFVAPASSVAPAQSEAWKYTVIPYLWAAGLSGDVDIGNSSQEVDVSFSDIVEDLSFAGMVGFEARAPTRDWAILADLLYIHLEDEQTNADITVEQFMFEADVAFQVGPPWLEVLAGARYWNLDVDVELDIGADASKSADWVDPIVGLRATFHPFSEEWTALFRLDGGGFGVGSESTYQILGGLDYAFNDSLSATVGYRHLDIDYDNDRVEYDIAMSGPGLGVLFSF